MAFLDKLNEIFFGNTAIPIVLASDENYMKYMYVTMISILENKKNRTFCDFYLLVPEKFDEEFTSKFEGLEETYQNCKVNFVEMGDIFQDRVMMINHISLPTYYRLKIAQILPETYDKAIYLDSDVIVLKDLTEFFNTDLTDYYVGGVKAAGYILNLGNRSYFESIGIQDLSNYINAGVTLWNLEKIRQDDMTSVLLKLSENDYTSQDQDIINLAFCGKIKILPLKYNVMTPYKTRYFDADDKTDFFNVYGKRDAMEAAENPVIIHYADENKPWDDEKIWLSKYWDKYASISGLFD
jgi:lipopolysaccharide biosynthesis glycosyltransferase